eukprot:COSAG01_NODE_2714_length_7204_cov_8.116397_2_plen_81_part_00
MPTSCTTFLGEVAGVAALGAAQFIPGVDVAVDSAEAAEAAEAFETGEEGATAVGTARPVGWPPHGTATFEGGVLGGGFLS